jgi:hypothetical protein
MEDPTNAKAPVTHRYILEITVPLTTKNILKLLRKICPWERRKRYQLGWQMQQTHQVELEGR